MRHLQIGNKPYLCINDQLLLVIADWEAKLYLLYSNLKPRLTFTTELFKIADTHTGYYWVGTPHNLYSAQPQGTITGATFEGTLFKFFNWVICYNKLNLPPSITRAMVKRALNAQGFEFLPDPLGVLERAWVEDTHGWRQRGPHEATGQPLFRTVVPHGLVETDPGKRMAMRGIAISDRPPPNEVLHPKLLAPYLQNLPKIRDLLNHAS